jgi:hypothetical protein
MLRLARRSITAAARGLPLAGSPASAGRAAAPSRLGASPLSSPHPENSAADSTLCSGTILSAVSIAAVHTRPRELDLTLKRKSYRVGPKVGPT